MSRLRTLIVDDEPLARERLRRMLEGTAEVEVVGECGNGTAAVGEIGRLDPDIVFLDVQMPELDGFGVLGKLPPEHLPVVVFVTAYDKYALRAFEVHALDYLLKPFDRERLDATLARVRDELGRRDGAEVSQRLLALLESLKAKSAFVERMVVKTGGRIFFLRVEEIDWIEAAGNYVKLHVGKESHLLRETMTALEGKLDPKRFLRIHRSTFVQIDRIKEIQPWFHGDYIVILRDGTKLTLSRSYRDRLEEMQGQKA
jgi:two-component system LytT family response regulator